MRRSLRVAVFYSSLFRISENRHLIVAVTSCWCISRSFIIVRTGVFKVAIASYRLHTRAVPFYNLFTFSSYIVCL